MEKTVKKSIAMEMEYVRLLVTPRAAVMQDASVTQVIKEPNANKVLVIMSDCKNENDCVKFLEPILQKHTISKYMLYCRSIYLF